MWCPNTYHEIIREFARLQQRIVRYAWISVLAVEVSLLGVPFYKIRAQSPDTSVASSSSLASITTDTGDFARGHRDFSRYTTSDLCLAAIFNTQRVQRRSSAAHADSLRFHPLQDTIGTAAIMTVARSCGTRVLPTSSAGIPGQIKRLHLALQQHDGARVRTLLAQQGVWGLHLREVMGDAIAYSLDQVRPPPLDIVSMLVHLVDSLSAPHDPAPLEARLPVLAFWERSLDTAHIRETAEAVLQHAPAPPTAAPAERDVIDPRVAATNSVYETLLRVAEEMQPERVQEVALRYCRAGTSLPWIDPSHCVPGDTAFQRFLQNHSPLRYRPDSLSLVPHFTADYQFPGRDGAPVVPRPGVVSILVNFNALWVGGEGLNDYRFDLEYFGLRDEAMREHVLQWLSRYTPQQVQVIAVFEATGGARYRGIQSPDREAEADRWYVQDFLHLPIPVAVQTVPVQWLPAPDGRRYDDTQACATIAKTQRWLFSADCRGGRLYDIIDGTGHFVKGVKDSEEVDFWVRFVVGAESAAPPQPGGAPPSENPSVTTPSAPVPHR